VRDSRRHKVRIVKRRVIPRAAVLSLVLALGAAAITFSTWRMFRVPTPVESYTRSLKDLILPYICDRGHEFNAPGAVGAPPCPICGVPTQHVTSLICPVHGEQRVEVQFERGEDGIERIGRLRLPKGPWVTPEQGLRCPKCQAPLSRKAPDDLSGWGEEPPKTVSGEPPVRKEIVLPGTRPQKDAP